jgi:hypothetical protein
MDVVQEVLTFARDYVNGNQTTERKNKIAAAYKSLFGESMKVGCGTCYVESIFKIKKKMAQEQTIYRLKPGVVLQSFGDASKTCTNINLTDELAEYHLRTNPGCIRYFSSPSPEEIQNRVLNKPIQTINVPVDSGLRILKPIIPEPEVLKPIEKTNTEILADTLNAASDKSAYKTRTRKPKK